MNSKIIKREYTKKPKVIVLDVDDVIFDFTGGLCKIYNRLNKTCLTSSDFKVYDLKACSMKDSRGNIVYGEDVHKTFREYEEHGLYAALPILPEARNAIAWMRKLGYKVFLMTARDEKYKKQTILNLINSNVEYDEMFFVKSQDKAKEIRKLSKEYNIQIFADDKASTIIDAFETTNVNKIFCINKPHNLNIEMDYEIYRVNGIMDIIRHLSDLNEGTE